MSPSNFDGLTVRNARVQRLRRLVQKRSQREAEGVFVAEGITLLREALSAGITPESVYYAPEADAELIRRATDAGAAAYGLAPGVMHAIADAVTPQPVCAVLPQSHVRLDALPGEGLVVVAVDVRDPGNAGTIIRTAAAAGARGVVLCDGTVDLYNPKTVRATAGALFRIPVVTSVDVDGALTALGNAGRRRLAAVARDGDDYTAADLTGPVALIVGNEAHGLPAELQGVDGRVTIPMSGFTESLNVGVATAVLCFEAARQSRAAVA